MSVQCRRCQAENRAGRRFCATCGEALPSACPRCGFENGPGDQYCGGCGQALANVPAALGSSVAPALASSAAEASPEEKLARYIPKDLAAKILATRGRIEGERRQVTVLFCDLAGSTRMAERLEAETYRQLIDEYLEQSIHCVHRYEGTITQFAGDGFMAIFGAPVAHDDDAARACRAALAIMAGLGELSRKWEERVGEPVTGRIGLNTGLVIVGSIGNDLRMDYAAIGDTTNVASRIQTAASPGAISLSEATRKLVAHSFETEDAGLATFKGKQEKIAVFRLVREIPRRERRHQALRGGLSRFYGRTPELALLRERYAETCGGSGQVVFIAGEAGIGKSRLIHELRRGLASSYTWIEGQCVGYGTRSTYHPFIDLLRGLFDIDESDSPQSIIQKVHELCTRIGGQVAAAEPFYRDLLSIDSGDRRLEGMLETLKTSHYFEAIRDLVITLGRAEPVVCLVEDVHWIDESSEQLLRRLLDAIAGARVLVLVTHRPEYSWPHGDRSYFSRISLHGLPAALVDELAQAVVGRSDLPTSVKRLIARRSDGNPFFVEELAKSLEERGVLDGTRTDGELASEIPSTIQEVLLARIDRLDDQAKRALQVAAVIGREFTLRLLERVRDWSGPPSDILEGPRSLELIYEKAVHPELAYMFKHALTHDVAYSTLLHTQRRELHRQIGALIEELYADRLPEFYETLAYQYRQAELPERAAHYALLSAERAASHLAPEAQHYFREAASLARGEADRADVFVRAQTGLGDQLVLQGQFDAGNEAYREALRVATDAPTLRRLGNKLIHRRFIERDGVRLAYYVQGKANEDADPTRTVPIVFLHPWAQGSYQFAALAGRLCQEYGVVYTDPRGLYASGKTDEPYDFSARVRDVMAVLQQLPYARFILHGDSDGVRMAARIFHELPGRVERMILYAGFARLRRAPDYPIGITDEQAEQTRRLWLTEDYRTGLANLFDAAFSEPGLSAWREVVVLEWMEQMDQNHLNQFMDDVLDADDRPAFAGIDVPTLVMAGTADLLVPIDVVRWIAEQIPRATFAVIKGAGHCAPWTAVDTYVEMVKTFIETGTLPRTEWEP